MHDCIRLQCDKCEYKSTDSSSLKTHVRSIHELVKYSCDQCDKKFSSQSALKAHKKSIHEGIKYPCDICNYEAKRQTYLNIHKKSVHQGITYQCRHCDFKDKRQSNLIIHIKSIHWGLNYKCNQCDIANTPRNLTKHTNSKHLGIKPSEEKSDYSDCNLEFDNKAKLRRHKLRIRDKITYPCNLCDHIMHVKSIKNWFMRVSNINVRIVTTKQQISIASRNILSQYMKVSNIHVINVNTMLHI